MSRLLVIAVQTFLTASSAFAVTITDGGFHSETPPVTSGIGHYTNLFGTSIGPGGTLDLVFSLSKSSALADRFSGCLGPVFLPCQGNISRTIDISAEQSLINPATYAVTNIVMNGVDYQPTIGVTNRLVVSGTFTGPNLEGYLLGPNDCCGFANGTFTAALNFSIRDLTTGAVVASMDVTGSGFTNAQWHGAPAPVTSLIYRFQAGPAIPEPGTMAMFGVAAGLIGALRWSGRRRS